MILVVGGESAGKRTFVRSLGYEEADMADARLDGRPVVFHVERLIFDNLEETDKLYQHLLQKEVVICNEVGSGVIPIDRADRLGREAVGRLCILLAKEADTVVRMVCGIPTVIKGALP